MACEGWVFFSAYGVFKLPGEVDRLPILAIHFYCSSVIHAVCSEESLPKDQQAGRNPKHESLSLAAGNAIDQAGVLLSHSGYQIYGQHLLFSCITKHPYLCLLGKCNMLLVVFMTLLKFPPCCSTIFNIVGITSEVFNEEQCYLL